MRRWTMLAAMSTLLVSCSGVGNRERSDPASTTAAPTTTAPSGATTTSATPLTGGDNLGVLDDQGCRIEGRRLLAPGSVTIAVDNQTDDPAFFALVGIGEEATYAEFARHVEAEAERLSNGEPMAGHPDYMTEVGQSNVAAHSSGEISATVEPGIHAIVCGHLGMTIELTESLAVGEAPMARGYHGLAYAGPGRGVLMCCGFGGPGDDDSEMQFDNRLYRPETGWIAVPAAQYNDVGDAIAYDSESDRLIVYALTETWAFDPAAQVWENMQPDVMPEGLAGSRMAYDIGSDRIILFGGIRGAVVDSTWAYDYETNTWTEMTPSVRPLARTWPALTYDVGADHVILFGGAAGSDFGDTWAYDFDTDSWEELTPTASPPPRTYTQMTYDTVSGTSILFGGVTGPTEQPLADTWAYDYANNTWTEPDLTTSPDGRGWHGLAADPHTGLVVLFGGGPTREDYTAETWTYDASTSQWSLMP